MTVALPQVLLCILAVVATFIFILATLICCLLRFVGPYTKIDEDSSEKNAFIDEEEVDPDAQQADNVKPVLIYHTLEPTK